MELSGVLTSREAPHRVGSLEQLIQRCDLVIVASPNNTHHPIAKQALEAGKHVVIDKPFTATVREANEIISLARDRQLVLSAFHNRRWDSDYLTVREVLPRLGEILLFEANWDRFRPELREGWKEVPDSTTGVLRDLGPHLIDQALQLFGMPHSLAADVAAQRAGSRIDDFFDLTLHYGRTRVCLRSSSLVAAARPRFSIHGTAGSFVKFGLDPQEPQLKDGVGPGNAEYGVDGEDGMLTDAEGHDETVRTARGNYLAYYEGIAAAILDGAPVPVPAEDARDGLALIDLARDAARHGRRLPVPAASSPAG
jgi:scyllo-inositol 2-dehydrogenase (NADP+)